MGFKVFIALVWLAVPVTLGLLLHADQQRYAAESVRQEKLCRQRAASLSRQALVLWHAAAPLAEFNEGQQLRGWQRDWNSATREAQRELPPLDPADLNHYPATLALLVQQQEQLVVLVKAVESASRDREYYLRGQAVLMELAGEIDDLNLQARYYSMMTNGRGIFLLLQEQLAMAESRYQAQDEEETRLSDAIRNELSSAQKTSESLQAALHDIPDRLGQDNSRTYFENVQARWHAFDLRNALARLITGAVEITTTSAPAASPAGSAQPRGQHHS